MRWRRFAGTDLDSLIEESEDIQQDLKSTVIRLDAFIEQLGHQIDALRQATPEDTANE